MHVAELDLQELGGGPRVEDLIASLRSGPSAPVQKSQDVIAGEFFSLFSAGMHVSKGRRQI